jgi:phosphoserine phosphatase
MTQENAVIFDVDGTLTEIRSIWQFIHQQLGTWETAGKHYLQQFLDGKISYETFARLDAREWSGTPLETMEAIVQSVKYMNGVLETFEYLNAQRNPLFIISSGLFVLVKRIIYELGVTWGIANELEVQDRTLTGGVRINVPWNGKGMVLTQISKKFDIDLATATAVGDSHTDISMFRLCGTSVAFNPSSEDVVAAATHVVQEPDLRNILSFL